MRNEKVKIESIIINRGEDFAMNKDIEKITVKYQRVKMYCQCCERELDKPETSEVKEFDFYIQDIKEYGDWKLYEEDEIDEVIHDYVYGTVNFYAVTNEDALKFLEGEVEKVVEFIKRNFLK